MGRKTGAYILDWNGSRRNLIMIFRPFFPEGCFGYVPYGPDVDVPEDAHGIFIEELAEELRPLMPEECVFLRFDLPWKSPYTPARGISGGGRCAGGPESEGPAAGDPEDDPLPETRIRELRMNFGSANRNIRKAPTDMQPTDTVLIDLNTSEETILGKMKKKTRYNIGLSRRKGVTVTCGGKDHLPQWYRLYVETAERKGIVSERLSYFDRLFTAAEGWRPEVRLFTAFHEDKPVGGIIAAVYKDRAYYLYGASAYGERRLMAPQLLQWEAIRYAREQGCRWYDLFGIPPARDSCHPMHGLYRFKTGFGGAVYHWRGCWDYPYDLDHYNSAILSSALSERYHV